MALGVRFAVTIWAALIFCGGGDGQNSAPISYIYTQTPCYERGFPQGASLRLVANGIERELAPGFAVSADAAISFDGQRVVFAGKQRSGDRWQIWEVPLAAGAARRITGFDEDAIAPFYLSEERIVYSRRTSMGFQLEAATLAGKDTTRLTFAPGDHIATAVLRDGRVLFDAPHAGGKGRDLHTVYVDGSGVEAYRCDHGRDRHSGMELQSGDIVFEGGGRLARFTSARATEVALPLVKGEFAGRVADTPAGDWLVSYRPDAGQPLGIYRWRPGQGLPREIARNLKLQSVEPVLVQPHPAPKRHPSGLGVREGANLLCLNAYTSRLRIAAGSVATVRVWALDDRGAAVALGEAPVEKDGSFFVETPTERAIRFELLDSERKTVAAEKGWFWARSGEQRVCVGCHAGPEHAPENAVPATLLRSIDPAKMSFPAHREAQPQ